MLTARALNRATLDRQLLLARTELPVPDAVRTVVALQAQHPASVYIALWNRLADFDPAELDAAFADRDVVRATLMRVTAHAVHGAEHRVFREAMEPTLRASRLGDPRFRASGMTAADADGLIPGLVRFARRPRTAAEINDWLAQQRGGPVAPDAGRMMRHYAPLLHAPTGGAWSFDTRQSYVAPRRKPVLTGPADGALQRLILRYLSGFGPATVADIGQFALVQRARVRAAVQALGRRVVRLDGTDLYDLPGAVVPAEETPAPPRLLGMWDNVLLAYSDRGRVIPPEVRAHVTRRNGDVLPTLLVDGYVAGVWRPVEGGIEASAFHPLPDDAWAGLEQEAGALATFLAKRDAGAYRRYEHWWSKLPDLETRRLV